MSDIESVFNKFQQLSIKQQRAVTEVIEELSRSNRHRQAEPTVQDSSGRQQGRVPNKKFRSKSGVPLAVGDQVRILNTTLIGRKGELATVTKFGQVLVSIQLNHSKRKTNRASSNLEYISTDQHA